MHHYGRLLFAPGEADFRGYRMEELAKDEAWVVLLLAATSIVVDPQGSSVRLAAKSIRSR